MSAYCPGCGANHDEDDDRLCSACLRSNPNRTATPGPWTVEEMSNGDLVIMAEGEPDAIAVIPYGGPRYVSRQKANARLLVSAPELLKACKSSGAGAFFDELLGHPSVRLNRNQAIERASRGDPVMRQVESTDAAVVVAATGGAA